MHKLWKQHIQWMIVRIRSPWVAELPPVSVKASRQHERDGDIVDVFPLYEDMSWLLSNVVAPTGSSIVVRSTLFVRSCLVVYASWPICMQTTIMMIAGYILYKWTEFSATARFALIPNTHREKKHAYVDDVRASTWNNAICAQQVNRLRRNAI